MRDWLIGSVLFAAYFAALAWFSLTPPATTGTLIPGPLTTNLLHLPAYTALGLAAAWMLVRLERGHPGLHRVVVLGLIVVIGVTLELLQPIFGRSTSVGDVAVNAVGGLLALVLWSSVRSHYRVRLA